MDTQRLGNVVDCNVHGMARRSNISRWGCEGGTWKRKTGSRRTTWAGSSSGIVALNSSVWRAAGSAARMTCRSACDKTRSFVRQRAARQARTGCSLTCKVGLVSSRSASSSTSTRARDRLTVSASEPGDRLRQTSALKMVCKAPWCGHDHMRAVCKCLGLCYHVEPAHNYGVSKTNWLAQCPKLLADLKGELPANKQYNLRNLQIDYCDTEWASKQRNRCRKDPCPTPAAQGAQTQRSFRFPSSHTQCSLAPSKLLEHMRLAQVWPERDRALRTGAAATVKDCP